MKLTRTLMVILALCGLGWAAPTTYYVNNVTGSDVNTPVQAQNVLTPWASPYKCAAVMAAGDTCSIAGTATPYAAHFITQTVNGTPNNYITYTCSTYPTTPCLITDSSTGWIKVTANYIQVIGFTFSNPSNIPATCSTCADVTLGSNTIGQNHNIVENNTCYQICVSSSAPTGNDNNIIYNNTATMPQFHSSTSPFHDGVPFALRGNNNLIANNTMHHLSYICIVVGGGVKTVVRNNTCYDINAFASQSGGVGIGHNDFFFGTGGIPTTTLTLTSVDSGTGVYTGTITGGGSNALAGKWFTITGFTNAVNNGTFLASASTTTTLTLGNANSTSETHSAFALNGGYSAADHTLIESNNWHDCIDDLGNCKFGFMRNQSNTIFLPDTNIQRYNWTYNVDGAPGTAVGAYSPDGNAFINQTSYNNTFALDCSVIGTANCTATGGHGNNYSGCLNCEYRNNILMQVNAPAQSPTFWDTSGVGNTTSGDGNGDLPYDPAAPTNAWPTPISGEATYNTLKNQNPLFVDITTGPTLQSGSPARNAGVELTTVAAGGCTGAGNTTISLNNVHFFQDGWGPDVNTISPVVPDTIRVGASTIAQIAKNGITADASPATTGTILLTSHITCSAADKVYLYAKSDGTVVLNSANPDIGAAPFASAPPFTVTATVIGGATGYITGTDGMDCGTTVGHTTCSENHSAGDTPVYTQHTSTGTFVTWGGSLASTGSCTTGNTCSPTYPASNTTLTATFSLLPTNTISCAGCTVNTGGSLTFTVVVANMENPALPGDAWGIFDPNGVLVAGCGYPTVCNGTFNGASTPPLTFTPTVAGTYQIITSSGGVVSTPATVPVTLNPIKFGQFFGQAF